MNKINRVSITMFIALLVTLLGALTWPEDASAYKAAVHRHMTVQAAEVSPDSSAEFHAFLNDIGDGVEDEDHQDHVYSYFPPGDARVTLSHFWDADAGDDDQFRFPALTGRLYANAQQKAQKFWALALGEYSHGHKAKAYEYLGHVAHLIGDNSLPTHAHEDSHVALIGDDDAYEDWMRVEEADTAALTDDELAVLIALGPLEIPPTVPIGEELLYLLYSTNQIADFFASDDVDGDDVDPKGWVTDELAVLGLLPNPPTEKGDLIDNDVLCTEVGGVVFCDTSISNDNDNDGDLTVIREHSYLRAIRAIATLYELFEEATREGVILTVSIDGVEERRRFILGVPIAANCHDLLFALCHNPDYYAKVSIGGAQSQNRGDFKEGKNISPDWAFGKVVNPSGGTIPDTIPVAISIWDKDCDIHDFDCLLNDDDQSDINPGAEKNLVLTIDLGLCLAGEAGAVSGDVSGRCGQPLVVSGPCSALSCLKKSRLTFTISVNSVPAPVTIDIKPGSDPNAINPRSKGVVPVAVLGSMDFDATQVDFSTVTFGPDVATPAHDGHVEDVNDDGFVDMVFHFKTQETGITCGDADATLVGETFGGTHFTGTDTVKTVGCNGSNQDTSISTKGVGAMSWIFLIGLSLLGLWRQKRVTTIGQR